MVNNIDQIIVLLKTLTFVELSDLIKRIENTFKIESKNTDQLLVRDIEVLDETSKKENLEPVKVNIVLQSVLPEKKIAILKLVRTITGLGLKECKDLVDNIPKVLKENISKDEANKILLDLEQLGGKAILS